MGVVFLIVIIVIAVWVLASCVRIVPQAYAVILERLGAYQATWSTGIHFKVPFIERVARKVNLKEQVVDFPPQPVITKDNVTMQIDTVVFFQITDPKLYTYGVENPIMAIENLSATTLRNIIGDMELDETLTSRETINTKMRASLDEATDPWGIKVNRVELKNIIPPAAIQDAMDNMLPSILNYIRDFASNIVPTLYSLSMSIMQLLLNLVIALIVSIYILMDKKILLGTVKASIYAFLPQKRIPYIMDTLKECNDIFGGFVIGKAIDSLIIGVLCFIVMTILRLPYTLLISLIVGITNMIPYFGPFIGAVPGAIVMLMVSPLKAVIFIIMIFALQQFDGLYLGPKILGQSVGLRPLWIIVAITIGGSIAGVLGMFLGVPIMAVLRYLVMRTLKQRLEEREVKDIERFHLD